MKLTVKNLGCIQSAEIELAPLTIFFGKNGTQKTWTAHAYFALLEQFRVSGPNPPPRDEPGPLKHLLDVRAGRWNAQIKAAQDSAVILTADRAELLDPLPDVLSSSLVGAQLSPIIGSHQPPHVSVTLDIEKTDFLRGVGERVAVKVSADRKNMEIDLHLTADRDAVRSTSYPSAAGDLERALGESLHQLATAWRKQVRVLPAERTSLAQIFLTVLGAGKPVPRALIDFCLMMGTAASADAAKPDGPLAAAMARVVGGEFSFVNRELHFQDRHSAAPKLPIQSAASLAKSIAGLSVFLASARPGDVLIVDEPEMNAHPEAQTAIVELFATMVREGMNVLLITHSPYIVDHVSTLVEASRLDSKDREALKSNFVLESSSIFLKPEEVAVYEFQDEAVRSVFDRVTGVIDWSTFTDVNDRESTLVREIVAREKLDAV